jgi:hypothetical protein
VTPDEYDAALDRVEVDLHDLSQGLREPVPDDVVQKALVALGTRAASLFRGFVELTKSDAPAASLALMRPAVEINLGLRFIVANPELHAEIWMAEGERESLKLVREVAADQELAARHGHALDPTAPWFAERERYVEEVRARALAAAVAGVGSNPGGRVMPDMRTIAFNHGDLASREAYTLAYRALSEDIHGSSRAFQQSHFEQVDERHVQFVEFSDPDREIRRNRALNATTFASTLCILSGPLGLDILDRADTLKQILMSATTEPAEDTSPSPPSD